MAVSQSPFDLLEAKLAAPLTRPGTVAKADVIDRLCSTSVPFATVIVAPAGYGKTTLLARWAEADPRRFAWVALDARDDDALVFLRYVAAAIHRVEPVGAEVFDALSGPGGSTWANRVPRVGSALAQIEQPFVLVFDDLHAITNPACLDIVGALCEYIPQGSQIAVASRIEPPLPLARWRAQGWVQEVGVADLRLDEQEASVLLAAVGVELAAGELATLTRRTEGWPAGLYLAALSLQAGATGLQGVESISGDDRFVADYFRDELVSRLPAAEAQFLKHTSVLERMSGELCDAVLDTARSADRLQALERTNCFVVPLDRRGTWYRYHHLFGELLRNELERSEPDVVPELHRRAMTWCLANGMTEAAIAYGHAAGETRIVAELVDTLALPTYYDGRLETLEEWLTWFSDDDLLRFPALAVYGAWARVLTGRHADAERWLALAESATSAGPFSDGSATIEPWTSVLRSAMMRDGVDRALADSNRALEQLGPSSGWIPDALLVRGVAHMVLGEIALAREDLAGAAERGLSTGAADVIALAHGELSLIAATEGAWAAAGQHAHAARAVVDEAGLGDYAASALAHVATARVAVHENRHEDARAALTRAHRLRPYLDEGLPWLTVQTGLELTRAHLALADAGAARAVLDETERIFKVRPDLGTLVDDARDLRQRVMASSGPAGAWAMSLTGAEIRLLPYLATHLSFPEIASRLFISRNTVKTEAVSIYRKLGASTRTEAVDRAVDVGLLEGSFYPARAYVARGG